MKPKTIAVGLAGLVVASAAPVIPVGPMTLLGSYEQNCANVQPHPAQIVSSPTSSAVTIPADSEFLPPVCNGSFAASTFEDSQANTYVIEIPKTQYAQMGQRGGYASNPTKEQYSSLVGLLMPPTASAAVVPTGANTIQIYPSGTSDSELTYGFALTPQTGGNILLDSTFKVVGCGGAGTGTSCTVSVTNTAGNFLACDMLSYTTDPGTVTMTYNGASMTQVGTKIGHPTGGAASWYVLFQIKSPATGPNNLVTTTTNSLTNGFHEHCFSASGASTTAPVENNTQATSTGISFSNGTSTTINNVTAGGWDVGFTGSGAGRTFSPGSRSQIAIKDAQAVIYYSYDSSLFIKAILPF